jgi:OmcA/MtrC family decaheme c-type cytochrome
MKVMTHKIHMGAALPSVESGTPYVLGSRDYSHVEFPQDHRNCTKCHDGPDADLYRMAPSRAACGACHDDVDFENGVGHFQQTSDAACSACHPSMMTTEFDYSVPGTHVIPEKSAQLPGYNAEITEVSNVVAGASPTITFRIFEDDLTLVEPIPANYDRLRVSMAGPTTDYMAQYTEDITSPTDNMDGTWSYTVMGGIPADAMGTWSFAIESRRNVIITGREGADLEVREGVDNPVVYTAVTGDLLPRREVVDQEKCHTCHDQLNFHGDQRRTVEYCVTCHNPLASDEEVRPATAAPPAPIDFKHMVHKIHRGEDLVNGYELYGHGSSLHIYSDLRYPGDLRNCEACHMEGTYDPPPPEGTIDTVVEYLGSEVLRYTPTSSACLACHDTTGSNSAEAHALANVSPGGEETCATCHGANRSASVFAIHAR